MGIQAFPGAPSSLHSISSASGVTKLAAYANGNVLDLSALTCTQSNAAAVSAWADRSTAGNAVTAGTATMSTTGWSDGGPCVAFAAASSQYQEVDGAAASVGAGDHSVAVLARRASAGAYHTFFSFGSNPGTAFHPFWQYFVANTNVAGVQIVSANASSVLLNSTVPVLTNEDTLALFSIVAATRQLTVIVNGQSQTIDCSAVTGLTAPNIAEIGAVFNGAPSTTFDGKMRNVAVWNRALGRADWRALVARWGAAYCHRYQVVIAGNSINAGYDGIAFNNPLQNFLYLPGSPIVTNTATGGWTGEQVLADFPVHVAPLLTAQPYLPAIYVVDEIRNSINAGDTAATAVAQVFACCDLARANGMFVVLGTPIDCQQWTGVSSAQGNANLAAALVLLRNGWQSHADMLVDMNAIPELSDASNTTYFNGDKIHPTQAGQRVRGSAYAPAIVAMVQTALSAMVLTP